MKWETFRFIEGKWCGFYSFPLWLVCGISVFTILFSPHKSYATDSYKVERYATGYGVDAGRRLEFSPPEVDIWVNQDGTVIINREISHNNDLESIRSNLKLKISARWNTQVNLESAECCQGELVADIRDMLFELGVIPLHRIRTEVTSQPRPGQVSGAKKLKYIFAKALIYTQQDIFTGFYADENGDEFSADFPIVVSSRALPGYVASLSISYNKDEIPPGMRVEQTSVGQRLVSIGKSESLDELQVLVNRDGVYVDNSLLLDFSLTSLRLEILGKLEEKTYSQVVLQSSGMYREGTLLEIKDLFKGMNMPFQTRSLMDQVAVNTHTSVFIPENQYRNITGIDVLPWETRLRIEKNGSRFVMAKPIRYNDEDVPEGMRIHRTPFGDKLMFLDHMDDQFERESIIKMAAQKKLESIANRVSESIIPGQWYTDVPFSFINFETDSITVESTNRPDRVVFLLHN